MNRVRFKALSVGLTLGALVSGACRSTSAPELTTSEVAGTYVLTASNGRGPATGNFVLTSDGQATRRVEYSSIGSPGQSYAIAGTFMLVRRDSISFALRETGGVWRVGGSWTGNGFRLEYPHPADGTVVETYRRLDR